MSGWKLWDDEKPPTGKLVIVSFDAFAGLGLRSRSTQNDLYDENDMLDDSGKVPLGWHEIPE